MEGSREKSSARRIAFARWVYQSRRLRSDFFPDELFTDPAWDVLLMLYSAEHADKPLTLSSVCATAGVPETTAYRWVERLITAGLALRQAHPSDRRATLLRLKSETIERLDKYLDALVESFGSAVISPPRLDGIPTTS